MATDVNFGTQQYFGFEPRVLPGCYIWNDASLLSNQANGTVVSTWSNPVSSVTITAGGTVSNAVLNGLTVVNFTTAQTWTTSPTINLSEYSMFVVSRQTGGTNRRVLQSTTNNQLFGYWNGYKKALYIDGNPNYLTTATSDTNWDLMSHTRFAGGAYIFNWNGTTLFSGSSSGGNNLTGLAINTGTYSGETSTCQIAELILYSNVLSLSQVKQVEGYLARKWGLTSNLPTGHPYLYTNVFMRLFQPPDVDGNILWLDSADQDSNSMTLSGTTITTWKDKSGNAKDFTSQLSPTTGTVNNLPIVNTTGGGCFTNGSFSIPIVYSGVISGYSTITAASNTWSGLLYGTPDALFMLRAFQAVLYIWKGDGGTWGSPSSTGPDATSNAIYSFVNPSSAGSVTLYVNGTSNHVNSGVANGATVGLDIGRWVNNTMPWKGYIGDVIFYSNAVTNGDRQMLEGYLGWKMGLRGGLATTHPFYKFPPATAIFHPMFLSNSTLWLDGADSTSNSMTFSGANITVWKDKSGNGKDFTASGTGATLGTSPPGLVFTTNFYTSSHNASVTNETMFLVFNSTKTAGASFPVGSSGTGGRELGFRITSSFGIVNNGVQWGAQQAATSNVTYFCKSTVTSASATGFSINGAALSTSNIGAFSGSTTTQLGRENTASFQYEGTVCEVIAYSRVLSAGEQRQVESYLAWKWNLQRNLPSNHPFYKFRP